MILGTPRLTSPEQARGKTLDKRTDVWAFGCCLFEVPAGRKACDGDTIADVLSRVLQREPERGDSGSNGFARLQPSSLT